MARFTGKVALISGAASGIGLATAKAFAAEGASVVLADISSRNLTAAVDAINATGARASGIVTDVTDPAACVAMVQHAVKTFGGLHIAFNNAGIAPPMTAAFEDTTPAIWDRVMKTNVSAMFYAMHAQVPVIRAAGGGVIVNTGSITSFVVGPGMPSYIASKHAVAGLTKSAAFDLIRHGIRVNAVCPGIIDTPILTGLPDAGRAALESTIPVGRFGTAEEVARAVLFLAAEESSYLVGTLLRADGGMTLP
jgi:NAD(P)-dependent dehydrogenase (short-subunit alcohol dehydrogenase family)